MEEEEIRPTILSVDDQPTNRIIIEQRFKNEYNIISAVDGNSALEAVSRDDINIDLILLDITMPDISGHEVCQKIRKMKRVGEIPIIFLTALGKPEEVKKGFEVGGNDYVTKPFNMLELQARIRNQLDIAAAKKLGLQNERLKTVGSMIASMNHEINNPLTILSGQLMITSKKVEIPEKNLKSMKDSIKRITEIVRKISNLNEVDFENYGSDDETVILDLRKSS